MHPQSRVQNKKAHEVVTTGSPELPGTPARNGFTAYFVISPVIGLSCHRRQQVTTCQLDASVEASGPHDFTVRSATFVSAAFASTASRPAFVTIAIRPFG